MTSILSSQPSLKHIVGSFFLHLEDFGSQRLEDGRLGGLKRREDEDCVVTCGPLSLFVILSQLWRLVVFQFCFVNFVAAK